MCLDSKKLFWLKPGPQDVISAFKVFRSADRSGVWSVMREYPYRRGVWYCAPSGDLLFSLRSCESTYPMGFHAFLDRYEAKEYKRILDYPEACILPVLLRGVHTKGAQDELTVVVASEMLVPMDRGGTK